MGRGSLIRCVCLAIVVAGFGVLALAGGVARSETLITAVWGAGAAGPIMAVLATAFLVVVMIPRTAVAAVSGFLFGPVAGAAYVIAGACLGAVIAFGAGRWAGRDLVVARARAADVDRWITDQGVLGVVTARLLPVAPFGLVSYALGATGIAFRSYAVGTVLGILPGTVVYAALGASATASGTAALVVAMAAAMSLPVAAASIVRRRRRSAASEARDAPTTPVTVPVTGHPDSPA